MAEATRRHIIETATPLFIAQGFEATSVRQLATAAGVAPQTLYNAFGSKFGVFSAVMDVIVAGDHEPVPLADRPERRALVDIADPRGLIAAIVAAVMPVLDRLSQIYPVLRAAAQSDPQVAEAHRRFTFDARHHDCRAMVKGLADLGALPPGFDLERATDIVWAVLSPDLYDLLVSHRRWSVETFTAWATGALAATLLDQPASPTSTSRA